VLIFLDIDGVLWRIGSPLDVLDADYFGRFAAVVRAAPLTSRSMGRSPGPP